MQRPRARKRIVVEQHILALKNGVAWTTGLLHFLFFPHFSFFLFLFVLDLKEKKTIFLSSIVFFEIVHNKSSIPFNFFLLIVNIQIV
jgi:hypothetical protein